MALGCLQIDTLQVVARSHYLALWSRLGCYDPEQLDALLFRPGERRYFEYWKKAASYIPLEHYRFSMARMKQRRERPRLGWQRWLKRLTKPRQPSRWCAGVLRQRAACAPPTSPTKAQDAGSLVGLEAGQARA